MHDDAQDSDVPRAWSLNEPSDPVMERRLREIVRLAPIGIGIVDMAGHTVLTNGALSAMLGYTADEFARQTFDTFTHADDIQRNAELFDQMVAGEIDAFEMDKRFIHRDGHIVWGRLQVSLLRDETDGPAYAIGMLLDVTEEKRLRDELERLAFEDPLTGLANRRLFHDRVASTTSSSSTTRSATRPATACSWASRIVSAAACAPGTPGVGSAGTSSPCCSRT
jgi:PAS domain S-box-containing protein